MFVPMLEQLERACRRSSWAVALAFAVAMTSDFARAADRLTIVLDQAQVIRMPEHTATIVVGNPLIADVSVQRGGMMVITGKGYGVTNLIALDQRGNTLTEQTIEVQGPRDNVVIVHRGIERETYSCTPKCERRATLGDAAAYFDAMLTQIGQRNDLAQGVNQPSQK